MNRTKVFLACSGLGRIHRGYESFTQECFNALVNSEEFDLYLYKGAGGNGPREQRVPSISRTSSTTRLLSQVVGRDSYWLEQASFVASLIPALLLRKPDIVYFSDGTIGNILWRLRHALRLKFRLLFSNGGPLAPPFPRFDMVQQLSHTHLQSAVNAGQDESRQVLVPYGFQEPLRTTPPTRKEVLATRSALGLPIDRSIVVAVGNINASHKRMDYVVREVGSMGSDRPYLVMLGQMDAESPAIRELAVGVLGDENFTMQTVRAEEVPDYLTAADAFVLASLSEGFGRVVVEALLSYVPCVVHDYALMREILQDDGIYCDATTPHALAKRLRQLFLNYPSAETLHAASLRGLKRFSWSSLRPRYFEMFRECLSLPQV